jgi:hypothetical protein
MVWLMARMSIDDKFLRDPRVKAMAAQLGVHHRHMRGWLLEVFAVCYDLETDILTPTMIDQAADHPASRTRCSRTIWPPRRVTVCASGARKSGSGIYRTRQRRAAAEESSRGNRGEMRLKQNGEANAKQTGTLFLLFRIFLFLLFRRSQRPLPRARSPCRNPYCQPRESAPRLSAG